MIRGVKVRQGAGGGKADMLSKKAGKTQKSAAIANNELNSPSSSPLKKFRREINWWYIYTTVLWWWQSLETKAKSNNGGFDYCCMTIYNCDSSLASRTAIECIIFVQSGLMACMYSVWMYVCIVFGGIISRITNVLYQCDWLVDCWCYIWKCAWR